MGALFIDYGAAYLISGFFGWDAKGIPTEATLKAYGLDYLIADVNAPGWLLRR